MTLGARATVLLFAIVFAAGCGGGSSPATQPVGATQGAGGTQGAGATPVATVGAEPTGGPAAGEPCSFLSGAVIGSIVGTVPVEIKERAGRGDCDYWLDADKTSKVNIGVTTGADGAALFESTKALGEIQPAPFLGDDAYLLALADLGTIVVVKQGNFVFSVQLLNTMDAAQQAALAVNVARAVVEGR